MQSNKATFNSLPSGLATGCLGANPNHTLDSKLKAIGNSGFKLVELQIGDYIGWVRQNRPDLPPSTCPPEWQECDEPDPSDSEIWEALETDAAKLKAIVEEYGLRLSMLQPLNQFDGWPKGSKRGQWSRRKAEKWLSLCSKLGVEFLQVGSNNLGEANGGDDKTAEDMRWLAELGSKQEHPVKIAYECWSFSERVNSWEHTWRIVQKADHPYLGLCMDVAQWCQANEYGWDIEKGTGYDEEEYMKMLDRVRAVPPEKIFYVEISDMLRPIKPLGQGSPVDFWHAKNKDKPPRLAWILCARPLAFVGRHAGELGDRGIDLGARVGQSVSALLDTGFKGPIILEFFEMDRMEQDDPSIPEAYAQASIKSWKATADAIEKASH